MPALQPQGAPTLVVIDYAEHNHKLRRELELFVCAILERRCERVRILLLARAAGKWWDGLRESPTLADVSWASSIGQEGGEDSWPLCCSPLEMHDGIRSAVFQDAVHHFRARLDFDPAVAVPVPDLSNETFGKVLYVHMAALASLLSCPKGPGESAPAPGLTPAELVRAVLAREKEWWTRSPSGVDDPSVAARVARFMAAVTLRGGTTREDAIGLATGVRGPPDVLLETLLRRLYPPREPGEYVGPLEPDELGSALVEDVLADEDTPRDFLEVVFENGTTRMWRTASTLFGVMQHRRNDFEGEAWFRNLCGQIALEDGESAEALTNFSYVAGLPEAPILQRARALVARAWLLSDQGDAEAALRDLTRVVEDFASGSVPTDLVAQALLGRGTVRSGLGDIQGALADFDRASQLNSMHLPEEHATLRAVENSAGAAHPREEEVGRIVERVVGPRASEKLLGILRGFVRDLAPRYRPPSTDLLRALETNKIRKSKSEVVASWATQWGIDVFRYCQRALASDAEAEDAMQLVFLQALEEFDDFRGLGSERAWLLSIARSRCLNRMRLLRRKQAAEDRNLSDVEARHRVHLLHLCLEQIPEPTRTAILLRYNEQMPYEKIEAMTGMKAGAIRVGVLRGLMQLKECLKIRGVEI